MATIRISEETARRLARFGDVSWDRRVNAALDEAGEPPAPKPDENGQDARCREDRARNNELSRLRRAAAASESVGGLELLDEGQANSSRRLCSRGSMPLVHERPSQLMTRSTMSWGTVHLISAASSKRRRFLSAIVWSWASSACSPTRTL